MYRLPLGLINLLLITNLALGSTAIAQTRIDQSQLAFSTIQPSVYDTLPQTRQTQLAQVWNITPKEYSRYLWLMNHTENGIYYANRQLDPTWILAINAKDEAERRHFTLQAIKNERLRLTKLLAFQQEFSRLQQELYPNEKPIADRQSDKPRLMMLQTNDMLLFFTGITQEVSINPLINLLQSHSGIRLNIYLVGRKLSDVDIQQWALQHQIPIDLVRQGLITLNHDGGRFNSISQGKANLPLLVLNRAGRFQTIAMNSLAGAAL